MILSYRVIPGAFPFFCFFPCRSTTKGPRNYGMYKQKDKNKGRVKNKLVLARIWRPKHTTTFFCMCRTGRRKKQNAALAGLKNTTKLHCSCMPVSSFFFLVFFILSQLGSRALTLQLFLRSQKMRIGTCTQNKT